jgi:hypothetical protein
VARRIFNALAEEPETVAAALAPQVRARQSRPRGEIRGSQPSPAASSDHVCSRSRWSQSSPRASSARRDTTAVKRNGEGGHSSALFRMGWVGDGSVP